MQSLHDASNFDVSTQSLIRKRVTIFYRQLSSCVTAVKAECNKKVNLPWTMTWRLYSERPKLLLAVHVKSEESLLSAPLILSRTVIPLEESRYLSSYRGSIAGSNGILSLLQVIVMGFSPWGSQLRLTSSPFLTVTAWKADRNEGGTELYPKVVSQGSYKRTKL